MFIDGPHPVSAKLQLRLPIRLARELGIEAGSMLFWVIDDSEPGTLKLVPEATVERRYAVGSEIEAATFTADSATRDLSAASSAPENSPPSTR